MRRTRCTVWYVLVHNPAIKRSLSRCTHHFCSQRFPDGETLVVRFADSETQRKLKRCILGPAVVPATIVAPRQKSIKPRSSVVSNTSASEYSVAMAPTISGDASEGRWAPDAHRNNFRDESMLPSGFPLPSSQVGANELDLLQAMLRGEPKSRGSSGHAYRDLAFDRSSF